MRVARILALFLLLPMTCAQAGSKDRSPESSLRIYLVRHGQTQWNIECRQQGRTNVPLNARGKEQAVALAGMLSDVNFDHIYTSRLDRTQQTSEPIRAHAPRTPLTALADLDEQDLGDFKGLRLCGLSEPASCGCDAKTTKTGFIPCTCNAKCTECEKERERLFYDRTREETDSLDGGESVANHLARVRKAVKRIKDANPGGTVLIVGHGGTNKLILRDLFNLQFQQSDEFEQQNAEVYIIDLTPTGNRLTKRCPNGTHKQLELKTLPLSREAAREWWKKKSSCE